MELSHQILSDITCYLKYARWIPEKHRRETWEEIVDRNKNMHIKKFPQLKEEIEKAFRYVHERKVLPSMRGMQFGGKPIEISPNRSYNCSAISISNPSAFSEIMFLLLGGSGVGYSVQFHHVDQLPEIKKPIQRKSRFLVNDSIEGWADTIKTLMSAYFEGKSDPEFDYRDIRPKGTLLKTSGGKAPGPQPLIDCVYNIRKVLDQKQAGDKLTPIECHGIICHIADAVLSGGIRRAALACLFSFDDDEMLNCKRDNWSERNPHFGRANNSAVVLRHRIKEEEFFRFWELIKTSNTGEPGIYWSNDTEYIMNPCGEISIKITGLGGGFCNLTTFDVSDINKQEDLNNRARAAAFIGTLQAAYTDFHYLRYGWERGTKKDALIGVSPTGLATRNLDKLDIKEAAKIVLKENERVADLIGIKKAARCCAVKPSGSSSLILGTSSGPQAWYDKYYIRRIRVFKHEAIYKYMNERMPNLVEDDYFLPQTQSIISIPVKAPKGAITKSEPVENLLERIKKLNIEWVAEGHRSGANHHNVSCFTGETRFITNQGLKRFDSFKDGQEVKVLNHKGIFVPATVKHFGRHKIWEIVVSNGQVERTIRTTKFHFWFIASKYTRHISKATSILDYPLVATHQLSNRKTPQLPSVLPDLPIPKINLEALLHGIVFGDGTRNVSTNSKCSISLCNDPAPNGCDSRYLARYFKEADYLPIDHPEKDQVYVGRLPKTWKQLPVSEDPGYIYWFIAGWFAADGYITKDTQKRAASVTIQNVNRQAIEWLVDKSIIAGLAVSPHIKETLRKKGYKIGKKDYSTHFKKETLSDKFFVLPEKLSAWKRQKIERQHQSMKWNKVISVKETEKKEDVYCVVEPENAAFVLEGFILTHNCTVYIKDSEWDKVGRWMWNNRDTYNGITVLPYDGGTYKQMPFESCSKETYEEMMIKIKELDLSEVSEQEDYTNLLDQAACSGGACTLT